MMHRQFSIRLRTAVLLAAATVAFGGVVEDAHKLSKSGKYDEAIALLEKADAKQGPIQKALAETHLAKGDFFLNNAEMPPFRKYPTALREYRKTLEYDKSNKKAQENIKTIEDIYKSMGREVPK